MDIPTPTSGVNGGPGAYPNSFSTCMEVKEPHKNSYYLVRDRQFYSKDYGPEVNFPFESFSTNEKRGIIFDTAGASEYNHIQNWTRGKIKVVYPRLEKKLFPSKKDLESIVR